MNNIISLSNYEKIESNNILFKSILKPQNL